MDIRSNQVQLTLDLDAGLTDRFRSAKDAMAAGVYRHGLKRVAAELDVAPGNLSVMLSDDGQRYLDIDLLERYVETFGDKTPIYYLVARHLDDALAEQRAKLEELQRTLSMLPEHLARLPELLAAMSDNKGKKKGR